MPHPPLSPNESRLAAFCRVLAVLYFAAALAFAVSLRTLAADALAAVLALSMFTAVATACLVAAGRPRERRHAILPALVAQLTITAAGVALLFAGRKSPALVWLIATGLPLSLLTAFLYRAAAPGVRSAPAREAAPPPLEEAPKIQLKVSKR